MKDILETLEGWTREGLRVAIATVVKTERSAPREPGAALAVNERGDVAGSVTGGCVEPAVYEEAQAVLSGGPPRLVTYGIADEEAFEVGLPCGGTVHIFIGPLRTDLVAPVADAVRAERPVALAVPVEGPEAGAARLVEPDGTRGPVEEAARRLLEHGETGLVRVGAADVFVSSFVPRPAMYVFGAVDHAAAMGEMGRYLGYRVTVCDARAKFATRERFPEVDELVVDWPDRFLRRAPVDERSAIVVLTHDHKFDVPLLETALGTSARYIGAMGSRRTTEERARLLRERGVPEAALARVHAPIGLSIGARTPEEVAVAVAAEIVSVSRAAAKRRGERAEAA